MERIQDDNDTKNNNKTRSIPENYSSASSQGSVWDYFWILLPFAADQYPSLAA